MRRLRELLRSRTTRWDEGVCALEGPDLVAAALEDPSRLEALYVASEGPRTDEEALVVARARDQGVEVVTLSGGVLERVADARTPQGVLATARFSITPLDDAPVDGLVLVLDNVRDPGNAGTIVRSADAAGACGVWWTGECVDPFNPKALRASAGSTLRVPLVVTSFDRAVAHLEERHVPTYATAVSGATPMGSCDLSGACAVVFGNESSGLD